MIPTGPLYILALYDLIGLGSPSRKPAAAEGKKKREKADDFPVFDPPRKVSRTTQGNAPGSSKTPSKSPTGDPRKQICADKDKATVSTSTQTLHRGIQAVSAEAQTEARDTCDCGVQTSPLKRMVRHSVTKTVTYRDDHNRKITEVEEEKWESQSD